MLCSYTQTWVDPILETLQSCSTSHQAHIAQVSSLLRLEASAVVMHQLSVKYRILALSAPKSNYRYRLKFSAFITV